MTSTSQFAPGILSPAPGVISTMIEEELMLFATQTSRYIELKGAAVQTWELIQLSTHSADQIAEALAEQYDADPAEIRADLAKTLADLDGHGVILRS